MSGRRHNGEGSIYAYPKGFRAYVWVTTPTGRRQRKYVSGKTRDVVHQKWLKLHKTASAGPVATKIPTLAVYLAGWLEEVVRPSLAPATVANYGMFVRLYIVPVLGLKRLDRLNVRDVQVWLNRLRSSCQCCAQGKDDARTERRCCGAGRCCKQLPSDWTVHQAWRVLRAGLGSAVRDGVVPANVAALVRMAVPQPEDAEVWTAEQARRFLQSALDDDDPLYVAYVLLLLLGLRRGEVLGLRWEAIDLDSGEARIRAQLQRVEGALRLRPVKTQASKAVLPLPAVCVRALQRHQTATGRRRMAAGEAWADSGFVVTTALGEPVEPRRFYTAFTERARAAGVPVIPVHSTRRSCATLLVALNVHPRIVMAILRHSQIAVTMDIYSQVPSEGTREALRQLSLHLGEPETGKDG
jgi:integrase